MKTETTNHVFVVSHCCDSKPMHTTAVWSSYHSCQSPLNLSTTSLRCVHHIFGTSNSMFGFYRISSDNNQPILEDLKCQNGLGPRFSLWFLQVRSTMWTSWMASPPGKGPEVWDLDWWTWIWFLYIPIFYKIKQRFSKFKCKPKLNRNWRWITLDSFGFKWTWICHGNHSFFGLVFIVQTC